MNCAIHDAPVIFGIQNGQGYLVCAKGQHAVLTVADDEHDFAMKLQEHQLNRLVAPEASVVA